MRLPPEKETTGNRQPFDWNYYCASALRKLAF